MMKYFPKALILATGASEKFLAFENNDLPGGVFGAGAVQTLMNLYGVSPAKKNINGRFWKYWTNSFLSTTSSWS